MSESKETVQRLSTSNHILTGSAQKSLQRASQILTLLREARVLAYVGGGSTITAPLEDDYRGVPSSTAPIIMNVL